MTFSRYITVSLIASSVLLLLPATWGQGQKSSDVNSVQTLPLIGPGPKKPHNIDPRVIEAGNKANAAISRGEMFLNASNIAGAIEAFQEALTFEPQDGLALQRLAEAYTVGGRMDEAVTTYRLLLLHEPRQIPFVSHSQEGSVPVLMLFALVLLKTNHDEEAQAVYARAAKLLNYRDSQSNNGKPYLKVLLPEFGVGPGQVAYTPQRLAAMANVAIGYENFSFGENDMPTHLREAVRLYPDSPVAQFYLAENLDGKGGHLREARDAYRAAAQLGGPAVKAEIDKVMKRGTVDYYAKCEQDMEDAQKAKAAPK